MEYDIINLSYENFLQWYDYINEAYGENHILTDWPFLNWFYGGYIDKSSSSYKTLIAVLPSGRIVGSYGVLEAEIRVLEEKYSFCWYVSGNVLPECRNQGIGKKFVRILLEKFDVCGVIGFNEGVKRNYKRTGFELFGDRILRRFIITLRPECYELVEKIGYDSDVARKMIPILEAIPKPSKDVINLVLFDSKIEDCIKTMESTVKVNIVRSSRYLNWRYFLNPRINYECIAKKDENKWLGYLTARHEQFFPTDIFGTRILDLIGYPENAMVLLSSIINRSKERGDAFIEFSYTGNYYDEIMKELGFTELVNQFYLWWPVYSTPIKRREENIELICLGSQRYPDLFKNIGFNDLYFTRGDTDRDRANRM